ncbi:MAG TPA: hypothetical protein VGO37_09965 [Steroidobacteraceae bacterium]|jgi:hypothetical protein|nr:hypothetical protein [Steroidobacteraceae bacterium]
MQPDFSQIGARAAPFLIAAVVVFAVYRRFRRTFGRQRLRPARMISRIVLLVVVVCVLLPMTAQSGEFLAAQLAGAALGIALGIWGAERTRFQIHGGQMHYLPHMYTGIAISLLFLGRLAFRVVQVYTGANAPYVAYAHAAGAADRPQAFGPESMMRSPLTLGIIFVLAGYYVCYYGRVLWKSKHLKAADVEGSSIAAAP